MAIYNYIACPSFEVSSYANVGGQTWSTWSSGPFGGSSRISRSSSASARGSYGLRAEIDDGDAGIRLSGIVLPATGSARTWTFSFDLVLGGTLYSPYCQVQTSGGTVLASRNLGSGGSRVSIQFTQNPGVTGLRIEFGASPGSGQNKSIGIDGLRLAEGSESSYLDGDTTGYVWAGTPGASQTIDAPSVTYNGVWNYWPRPRLTHQNWVAYWEAGGQSSGGMTVTNGPSGVTVSGTVSRSSTSNYRDIGAQSGEGSALLPLGGLPAGTAYLSASITSISGALANDTIKLLISFWDESRSRLFTSTGALPISGGRAGGAVNVPSGAVYANVAFTISTATGFTSSPHTVTATIDQIRLATQNSLTYIDGTTAGYAWKNTANDSVTIAAKSTQASGSGSSIGNLDARILRYLSATAHGVSTGSLELWLQSVESIAYGVSTGSLELWPYGPAGASASGESAGSLRADTIIFISASGTGTSTGTAGADIARLTFADGAGSSTGSLVMRLPDELSPTPITASGSSTGSIQMSIAGVTSASGEGFSVGSLDATQRIPAGSFGDFAIFGLNETDPLKSVTANSNGGVLTGAAGEEWNRVYGEFTVPATQTSSEGVLWKRAAYVVPGIKFDNVPAGAWQEFTQFQVEISGPDGPTDFQPAATLRPLLYADRINLCPHTIDVSADPGPADEVTDITSPIDGDPTGGLRVTVQADQQLLISTALDWLRPNAVYTASMYVSVYGTIADLGISIVHPETLEAMSAERFWSQVDDAPDMPGWRRVHVTFSAPDDGQALIVYNPRVWDQTADEFFDVAGMLVEEGRDVGPYFWPDGTSQEIINRNGYSDISGGIFYHRDRERRTYILKKALTDHVPTGIGIGEPEFGTIPHIDL